MYLKSKLFRCVDCDPDTEINHLVIVTIYLAGLRINVAFKFSTYFISLT